MCQPGEMHTTSRQLTSENLCSMSSWKVFKRSVCLHRLCGRNIRRIADCDVMHKVHCREVLECHRTDAEQRSAACLCNDHPGARSYARSHSTELAVPLRQQHHHGGLPHQPPCSDGLRSSPDYPGLGIGGFAGSPWQHFDNDSWRGQSSGCEC